MLHHETRTHLGDLNVASSARPEAVRTLQIFQDLFQNHPHTDFAIQSLYISTKNYGVVTLVRWKPQGENQSDTYSIGINTTNLDWPSLRYNVNAQGEPGPLSLTNAAGRVARLKPFARVPSANELLDAALCALTQEPPAVSYHIPESPNLNFCM